MSFDAAAAKALKTASTLASPSVRFCSWSPATAAVRGPIGTAEAARQRPAYGRWVYQRSRMQAPMPNGTKST